MATFYKDAENHFLVALSSDAPAPEGYTALEANTTDAAQEKHVPVVACENDGRLIHVTVGSTEHPMQDDHLTSSGSRSMQATVWRCMRSSRDRRRQSSSRAVCSPVPCMPTATCMGCGRQNSSIEPRGHGRHFGDGVRLCRFRHKRTRPQSDARSGAKRMRGGSISHRI